LSLRNTSYINMYDGGVITSQVTVSVTNRKEQQHLVSWLFLWLGYLLATIACGVQVQRDRKSRIDVSDASDSGQATANNREGNDSSGESTRSMVRSSSCPCTSMRAVVMTRTHCLFASPVLRSSMFCFVLQKCPHPSGNIREFSLLEPCCRDFPGNSVCICVDTFRIIPCSISWYCLRGWDFYAT
jgi:hypothetical protein